MDKLELHSFSLALKRQFSILTYLMTAPDAIFDVDSNIYVSQSTRALFSQHNYRY